MRTKITIYNNKVKSRQKQNENEVLVSVWRPKAKKCQLAVIAEGKRKLFPMYPAKICGMEDYFTVVLQAENLADRLQGMPYFFVADGETFCDSFPEKFSKKFFSISENVRSFASRKSTPPSWK